MRHEDLYLSSVASFLPRTVSVDDAVMDGRYDPEEQEESGVERVAVAGPGDSAPAMAVRAARAAVHRSPHEPGEIDLLLHAVTAYNGLDGWNAACYLQKEVLGGAGTSFEVRQLSNGAMACVELAAAYLSAAPDRRAALITAADQFAEPAWDRWRTGWGMVFADGASAAVLSRVGGFARVRSTVTVTDPELEGLHRGELGFGAAPDPAEYPIDFRARTLDFARSMDLAEAGRRMAAGLRDAVSEAADEAGISAADADHYVVPGFGRRLLLRECLDPLELDIGRSTWSWSAQIGHLGAADQFAALAYLAEAGRLAPGDKAIAIGIGGGFNWTCIVLEVLEPPVWRDRPAPAAAPEPAPHRADLMEGEG
ncbi:ketoacyl-ACP synthase III family protein [Actinomadura harenae]|uniref:3-oxoacyl-ACP synthase n=1 Tax=Actinomadura harenae TaxID=2483351 RepID=A0A3M2M7V0_9ACTN|nr:ketoacyl-ACP synthase III family protein [Actinomadura harenae]RMI43188.1 3-oxoacyl-ACP synthase [Actinomadura harenae]